MSRYYLVANKTKKEFISHGCIEDLGIHKYPYYTKDGIGRLLIYLLDSNGRYDFRMDVKHRFNPENKDHWEEGWFEGHWAGDELYFVNDQGCIIGSDDDNYYEGLYDAANYAYTDITFPAANDYNRYYFWDSYDDDSEEEKAEKNSQRFSLNETFRTKDNFQWHPYEEIVANEKYSERKRGEDEENGDYLGYLRTPILFKKGDKVKLAYTQEDLTGIKNENEKYSEET